MKLFFHRPLALFCFFCIAVCAVFFSFGALPSSAPAWLTPLLLGIAFAVAVAAVFFSKRGIHGSGGLALAMAALGILTGCFTCLRFDASVTGARAFHPDPAVTYRIEGSFTDIRYSGDSSCFAYGTADTVDGKKVPSFGLSLSLTAAGSPRAGDRFSAAVTIVPSSESENDVTSASTLAAKGIFYSAEGEYTGYLGRQTGLRELIASFRAFCSDGFHRYLSEDGAALADALLLGERDSLRDSVKRDFRTLGVSHLLAVSGLHLSVILGAVTALLQKANLRKWVRGIIQSVCCLFYMAICGFSGSICRAGIMYLLFTAVMMLQEDSDSVTTLFAAGTIILLIRPYAVLDVGLQLSFLATLGILSFGREMLRSVKTGRRKSDRLFAYLRAGLAIGIAAGMMTFPVSLRMGGRFSLLTVPATILLSPFVTVLLALFPVALILSVIPPVGGILFRIADAVAGLMLKLVGLADPLHSAVLPIGDRAVGWITAVFSLCLLAALLLPVNGKLRYRLPVGLFLLILVTAGVSCAVPVSPGVNYYADAKNEALLLCSDGKTTLVDISGGGKSMLYPAADSLADLRAASVDRVVYTHLHDRHTAQAKYLFENQYIREIYLPVPRDGGEKDAYTALTRLAERYGVKVYSYDPAKSETLSFGGLHYTPYPTAAVSGRAHPAVAFSVRGKSGTLLYLGSGYPVADLGKARFDATILGCHGGNRTEKGSLSDRFGSVFADTDTILPEALQGSVRPINESKRFVLQ